MDLIKRHYQKLRRRLNYLEHLTDACKRRRENRQQVIQLMVLEVRKKDNNTKFRILLIYRKHLNSEFKNLKPIQNDLVNLNYFLP